jgi:hypothetical protein
MTFDTARAQVVLFGGSDGEALGDTWEWDGTTWELRAPADPEGDGDPAPRYSHAMAYDSRRSRVVLFGGNQPSDPWWGPSDETWEWDGASWARRTPSDPEGDGNPEQRFLHGLAYDEARGRVVLFGGTQWEMFDFRADTWEWDGASWARRASDSGSDPSARYGHAMAYDATHGQVTLFGGLASDLVYSDETWLWDGETWHLSTPTDPEEDGSPESGFLRMMTYDPSQSRILLLGTEEADDGRFWSWDGASWARHIPADPEADGSPTPSDGYATAYDAARGRLVLFGDPGPPAGPSVT